MPHTLVSPHHRNNAKSMRRVMTDAELKLWNELRAHRLMGLGFRRQVPPIAGYIVDFVCPTRQLIVEVDGSQHGEAEKQQSDELRTRRLEQDGWTVLRFWNDDILRDIDNVCSHIVIASGLMAEDAARQAAGGPTRPLRGHPPRGGEGSRATAAPRSRKELHSTETPTNHPEEHHP